MKKMMGVLVAVVAAAGLVVGACSKEETTGTKAAGESKGKIMILWAKWPPADALQKLCEDYKASTGVAVTVDQKPWGDISVAKQTEFNNNSTTYDIIIGDSQWVGQGVVGKHYMNLTETVKSEAAFKDVSPAAMKFYAEYPAGSKQYYAVPCESDAVAVAYRKDLFEDPKHKEGYLKFATALLPVDGIQNPEMVQLKVPATWEHLLLIARYFKEGAGMKDMAGIVMPTTPGYDQAVMAYQPIMWSFGGSWGDQAKYTVTVDSPETVASLKFLKELIGASSEGAKNMDYGDVDSAFCSGHAAMAMTFFAFFPTYASAEKNRVYWDKTGYFNVPAGPKGRYTSLGGQGMSINAHVDEARRLRALAFVRWFSSPEVQAKWAKLGGFSANMKVLQSEEFKKAAPYNPLFEEAFGMMQDFWNIPQYDQMLTSAQEEVCGVIQGKTTPEEAAKNMQETHVKVLKKAGYIK